MSGRAECRAALAPEAWYGPPKFVSGAGPQHFVYNVQYLAGESPRFLEVRAEGSQVVMQAKHTSTSWTISTLSVKLFQFQDISGR